MLYTKYIYMQYNTVGMFSFSKRCLVISAVLYFTNQTGTSLKMQQPTIQGQGGVIQSMNNTCTHIHTHIHLHWQTNLKIDTHMLKILIIIAYTMLYNYSQACFNQGALYNSTITIRSSSQGIPWRISKVTLVLNKTILQNTVLIQTFNLLFHLHWKLGFIINVSLRA